MLKGSIAMKRKKETMDLTVDALGQECPIPVVRTKQALSTIEEGVVATLVDNETAVHNLENLAKTLKCTTEVEDHGDGTFTVRTTKDENSVATTAEAVAGGGARVVVIATDNMGHGDDTLGHNLMKAFIFALTQQDVLPDSVLFYNGGVHLTTEGSECLEDIQKLADAGVEILSCGNCLKFYEKEDQLKVGDVTNMYVIVEKQLTAGVVVRP